VAGPSEDLPAIVTEAPEAPSDEKYVYTAFVYTREEQSVRIIRDKQTGYGFVEFIFHAAAEKILQTAWLSWVAFGAREVRFGLNDVRQAVTNAVANAVAASVADVEEPPVDNNSEVGWIVAGTARWIQTVERSTYAAEVKGIRDDDAPMVSWQDPWKPVATARC
jgi:hypothetical protein